MKKKVLSFLFTVLFVVAASNIAQAMHIMEGYLPLMHCILWGAACVPFIIVGIKNMGKLRKESPSSTMIVAMAGAYAFVLSALKIPSVTGSSSHPTGTGLAAIFFGPTTASVLGLIVLLFQAILLAHGGLTTLGANTMSMGIVGPLVSYGIFKLGEKTKMNRNVAVFLAASLGDLATYCVTSVQLALAHPDAQSGVGGAIAKFASIFAVTQIPLAIIEGLLTTAVVIGLQNLAKPELESIGFIKEA